MATKEKKFGPRVTVSVGKDSRGKAIYSFMLKKHADYFNFPGTQNGVVTRRSPKGKTIPIRGAVGQNHIKVPTGKKTSKGATQYYQMPMPPAMTIAKISSFLKTARKNKPESFVTQDGKSYPVAGR